MSVSIALKIKVWDTYIGRKVAEQECPLCENEDIRVVKFHCAHVLAIINGGDYSLENLRPICSTCNGSMGERHMKDFAMKFFPNSPLIERLPDNPRSVVKNKVKIQDEQRFPTMVRVNQNQATIDKSFIYVMEKFMNETQNSMREIKESMNKNVRSVANNPHQNVNIMCMGTNENILDIYVPNELPLELIYIKNSILELDVDETGIIRRNYKLKYNLYQSLGIIAKKIKNTLQGSYLKTIPILRIFTDINERYSSISKLTPHIQYNQNIPQSDVENKFKCNGCGKSFVQKSSLNRHINENNCINLNYSNIKTKNDEIVFIDPASVGDKVKCTYCETTFSQKASLTRHLKDNRCRKLIPIMTKNQQMKLWHSSKNKIA